VSKGPWLDDDEQKAWRSYLLMTRTLETHLERHLQRDFGLSKSDFEILVNLSESESGRMRAFELSRSTQWEKSRLSHHLTRMEKRGLIRKEACDSRYPEIVITEPHHTISHHREKPDVKMAHATLNAYHMSLFAKFIGKLKATPDGDGTLLDHSLILYGSGMSESDRHSRINIPTLLAGGLCGTVEGNRHIQTAKETPFSNLLLSIANKYDCEMDKFGISTGNVSI